MIQETTPPTGIPLPLQVAKPEQKPESDGLGHQVLVGYVMIGTMLMLILMWAYGTVINGAVVGAGSVVVENNEKLVQHPAGGVVGQILVEEGSVVKAGDILMRLDDTSLRANLGIVDSAISALTARLARLEAERDGASTITFPAGMTAKPSDADRDSMRSESQFFASRRSAMDNRKLQLEQKIGQLTEQTKGYDVMIHSRKRQWELVDEQLATARDMLAKNLTTRPQVSAQEQNSARLEGEYGALISERAGILGQITETRLQIAGLVEESQTEIMRDLRETEARIAEETSRQIAARDLLSRVDIRAPAEGRVHELVAHTVGGVINPGETIMKIVPDNAALQFQVRISPSDIDQISKGQLVNLRFPAFNRSKTPEITGRITLVGADASVDRQTGHSFYEIKVAPEKDAAEILKEKDVELVPGMPVEAYMETGERSTLSYLLKPLTDQISRAFREE